MNTCEFLVRRDGHKTPVPCGTHGARMMIIGKVCEIVMDLCEYHKNFVVERYDWTVSPCPEKASDKSPQV